MPLGVACKHDLGSGKPPASGPASKRRTAPENKPQPSLHRSEFPHEQRQTSAPREFVGKTAGVNYEERDFRKRGSNMGAVTLE